MLYGGLGGAPEGVSALFSSFWAAESGISLYIEQDVR